MTYLFIVTIIWKSFVDDIPFVTKTIRMLQSEPKDDFAYNAIEVERSMRRKYEIK